jgi:hypothetical protein
MIKEIGFFIPKIDNKSSINIINTIAKYINHNKDHHCVLFNSHTGIEIPNNIPILHLYHARFFNGILIVNDIQGMIISNNFTNFERRILYADRIPWYGNSGIANRYWKNVFKLDKTDIIVNNQYTYDIFDICFQKPIAISEHFKYEEIKQYI